LGRIFNFKLGYFVNKEGQIHVIKAAEVSYFYTAIKSGDF